MIRYLAVRIAGMIPVVLLVSTLAFVMIHLVPGDPARQNLPRQATPEQVEQRRHELGLDRSLPAQYVSFIGGAVTGDFGTSIQSREDVGSIIGRRAGPSMLLVLYSVIVAVALALPLAIIAAVRRETWVDRAIQVLPTFTFVMPPFWLALLLVIVFSLQLGLFPTSGYGDTLPEQLRDLTLPAVTMGLFMFPMLIRLLRSGLVETMKMEYVESARARGLSELRVMLKHVLRNSVMSTVTLLGFMLAVLLSATVIVEQIFSIPGLGSLLVTSVGARDYPVVQALTLLLGLAVPVASLVTDLVYAALDPRVRL